MTTDIVVRLRNTVWDHCPLPGPVLDAETCLHDMREAAREIERLRSELLAMDERRQKAFDLGWCGAGGSISEDKK